MSWDGDQVAYAFECADSSARSMRVDAREGKSPGWRARRFIGELQRAAWLIRHGVTRRAKWEVCPCLLGTKKQVCEECRGRGPCTYACPALCGFPRDVVDHDRTYIRGGVPRLYLTEPYGFGAEKERKLIAWAAPKGIAVFRHPNEEGFHNPGSCIPLAMMPERDAAEYARLEPLAVLLTVAREAAA